MEPIKMTLAAAITLYDVVNHILIDENGEERDFPFDVKYKLQRNRTVLQPDFEKFNKKRVELIREFGVEDAETHTVSVSEDHIDEFRNQMIDFASEELEHTLLKLSVEDTESIKVPGIKSMEMELFMATMVDDPEFRKSIEVENPNATTETATDAMAESTTEA